MGDGLKRAFAAARATRRSPRPKPAGPSAAELKVLAAIYLSTDCCNEVFDYATLHWSQARIAASMPSLVCWCDSVVSVDGDGFTIIPERYGRGYRLTRRGYEALTRHDPEGFPPNLRRFAALRAAAKVRESKR